MCLWLSICLCARNTCNAHAVMHTHMHIYTHGCPDCVYVCQACCPHLSLCCSFVSSFYHLFRTLPCSETSHGLSYRYCLIWRHAKQRDNHLPHACSHSLRNKAWHHNASLRFVCVCVCVCVRAYACKHVCVCSSSTVCRAR